MSLSDLGMRGSNGVDSLVRSRSSGLVIFFGAPMIGLPVKVFEVFPYALWAIFFAFRSQNGVSSRSS